MCRNSHVSTPNASVLIDEISRTHSIELQRTINTSNSFKIDDFFLLFSIYVNAVECTSKLWNGSADETSFVRDFQQTETKDR